MTLAKTEVSTTDKPVKLSWGLDEIVKLSKAKVDESVILTFIGNSETAYNPTAQDIIQLGESGVSREVITALMRHGEGLRQTARETQKQVQADQAAVATAPVYQAPPTYSAPASTVTYIGYRRYDAYPSHNYSYGYPGSYYYPRYYTYGYYPRFSLGVGFAGGYHHGYGGWGGHCR